MYLVFIQLKFNNRKCTIICVANKQYVIFLIISFINNYFNAIKCEK